MQEQKIDLDFKELISEASKSNKERTDVLKELKAEDVYENFGKFNTIIEILSKDKISEDMIELEGFVEMFEDFCMSNAFMFMYSILVLSITTLNFIFFILLKYNPQIFLVTSIPFFIHIGLFFLYIINEKKKILVKKKEFELPENQKIITEQNEINKVLDKKFLKNLLSSKYEFINSQTNKIINEELSDDYIDECDKGHVAIYKLKYIKEKLEKNIEILNLSVIGADLREIAKKKKKD